MDKEIKNLKGDVIGHLKAQEEVFTAFDLQGNLVGSYNPKSNTTYTKEGKTLGLGNQLAALLYR